MIKRFKFLKVNFLNLDINNFDKIIKKKGLFVFPSGPGLANLIKDQNYHKSLINSDYVFLDSGYLVLLLRLLKNIKVQKFSGYKFLKFLFNSLKKRGVHKIFFIDPSLKLSKSYKNYVHKSLQIKSIHYIAPKYDPKKIQDKKLIKQISVLKPKIIIINIGGGIQEILGFYLKNNLKYKPMIICTGAAIAYLTKDQAPINNFIDKIYLGWLLRIIVHPSAFFPRYIYAFKLFFLVLKNKITISFN